MTDYIEITDLSEVIRHGDEYTSNNGKDWTPFNSSVGEVLGETHWFNGQAVPIRVRRPVWTAKLDRLRNIEQKAIALLRDIYAAGIKEEDMYPQVGELRKAIGVTVGELRGASSKS